MRKETGWDIETKLLYQIYKQLDILVKVASTIQGGGGSTTTSTSTTIAPTTTTTSTVAPTTTSTTSSTSTSSTTLTTSTTTQAPENLLRWSNKFDEYATWQQYGGTFTPAQQGDQGWLINLTPSGCGFFQEISGMTPGSNYCYSAEFKVVPSGFRIGLETASATIITYRDITSEVNGTTYTRISISGQLPIGQTGIVVVCEATGTAGNIQIRNAQLNTGTTPKPYIETN